MSAAQPLRSAPSRPAWRDHVVDRHGEAPLPVRVYAGECGTAQAAAGPLVVVHFHGGAFVAGGLESGAEVARLIAACGATVVSVDYPLAPAHPFPAAVEAGYAALEWAQRARARLAGPGARLVVAGEEAGGNLAAALAQVARDRAGPSLAGQVLLSPMLDACMGTRSMRCSNAGPAGGAWARGWCSYLGAPSAAEHPYAMPGHAVRLAGLAAALVVTAEDDPMRDEALAYARRLRLAGVAAEATVLPRPTGWPGALMQAPAAAAPWRAQLRERLAAFFAGLTRSEPISPNPAGVNKT